MAKNIVLDSDHSSYDKKAAGDEGTEVSISLADGFSGGSVSNLEEGDNIDFAESHLLRNWRDGVENTLTVESGLRTINITDYFGGETAYPAITLNSDPLPNDLTVKIANDVVFTTPYSCDPNFNEIITGIGYVEKLGEGDKIACHSSPEYYFDSEGLGVQDDENDIVIADNTTGQTDKVYVGGNPDDISGKTLTVTEISNFDGSTLGYKNFNITGTNDNDTYTGGAGDDEITTGTGDDTVNAGAGADTIYIDGIGAKTVTGGEGNNTFIVSQGTAIITDSKAGDVIAIEAIHQGTDDFVHFTFERGEGDSTSLFVIYNDPEHLGDFKTIEIQNYFKKVGDDYVMNDNAVTTFRLIGYNSTQDHELAWKQSPVDGSYDMYKVLIGNDEPNEFYGAMHIKNWIEGKGEADMLHGASFDDVIIGGPGDDLINGSKGNDYMDGGDGYNIFAYDMNLLTPGLSDIINNPHLGDLIRFNWNVPRIKATYDFDNEQAVFTFYANIQDEEVDYRTIYVKGFNYYNGTDVESNINNIEIFNGADYSPYMILGNVKFDRIIDNSYEGVYFKNTPYMENLIITSTRPVTVVGLLDGDNIVFESVEGASTSYSLDENGMKVVYKNPTLLGSQKTVTIADFDYTTDPLNVLIGDSADTNRDTLEVSGYSVFDATEMVDAFNSYNITGTSGDDTITTGDGNDTIYTGAGDDVINGGAGDDTIYTEGIGEKTVTGGDGANTFVCGAASTTITDSKAGDVITIEIPNQDANDFYGFSFVRGDGTPESESTDLNITYHDEKHLGDDKLIVLENYFTYDFINEAYVMSDDAVNNFRLIGSNYTKDYILEWRQSPADGSYNMYNVVTEPDEDGFIRGSLNIRNWLDGRGQVGELCIIGDESSDVIYGGSNNDDINGGYGNDYIDAGAGYNIFEFDMNLLAPRLTDTITHAHLGDLIKFNWNVPDLKATYDFDNHQALFTFYANEQGQEEDFRTLRVNFDYYDTKHKNIDNIEIFNGANYTPYMILGNIKFDRIIDNSYGGVYVKDTPYMENLIITSTIPVTVSGLLDGDNIVFDSVEGASTSYLLDDNGMTVVYQNTALLGSERTVTVSDFDYTTDPLNVLIGNEADTNRDRLVITGYSDFHADKMVAEFNSYDITTNDHDSYIYTGAGNDVINTGAGDDFIESGAGDDYIVSGAGTDSVNSGDGDDVIFTGAGNDIIFIDGEGTKTITGGEGNNTFRFTEAGGSAIINDAKAGDEIQFATFDVTKLIFTKGTGANAQDLIISNTVEGDDNTIVIKNYFNMDGSVADDHINTFIIDNVKYTFEWLEDVNGEYHMYNVIEGTADADELEAVDGMKNWIKGKGANDTLTGADEDDVFEGNADDDIIIGGEGSDTFVFNPGDGHDTIKDAEAGDIIVLGKGSAPFSDDMFARSAEEGHTDDLIITYSPSTWANKDTVTIENYFSKAAGLRLSTFVTSDGVSHEYIAADEVITSDGLQDNGGKIDINKDATGEFKVDGSEYVSLSTKGINVNNKSANAVLDVTGSLYNDTISTSKSTGNNTVVESYGTNKVTTGSGDDYVKADKYSSNTINVGDGDNIVVLDSAGNNKVTAGKGDDRVSVNNYSSNTISVGDGNNEVILDGFGTNKVTAGNDNNTISANTGINTIKLGKGNNEVSLAGGINTVKTGAGNNIMTIGDGINKVTTGNGDDTFTIYDGNNTFNSGAAKTQITYAHVGGDRYYINGGNNTIKTTGSTYVNIADSSTNTITTGSKNDVFEIADGVNNIKGGAGIDTYIFNSLEDGDTTLITDSKGNDIYDFSAIDSTDFDGLVVISDKNGSDTIKLANNELKLFFDGTFKYNKSKKTGTFTFGKNVGFVEEVTTEVINGIQISGKSVDKLNIYCEDNSLYNIDKLKSDLTAWFTEQAMGGTVYKSVDAVFNSGDDIAINSLLNVYNQVPPNDPIAG